MVALHDFFMKKGRHQLAGALRMGVCDGVPSRSVMYDKGLIESPLCLRCNELPDSPSHRLWRCSANCSSHEVATIPSKRLRNKIAGFTTHLMKDTT